MKFRSRSPRSLRLEPNQERNTAVLERQKADIAVAMTSAVNAFLQTMFWHVVPIDAVREKIYIIRGNKVMLSHDLATLYEVEPRALSQAGA